MQTDGGVLLKDEEHKEVAEVAQELQKYCVNEPVKCPLIFGGNSMHWSYPDIALNVTQSRSSFFDLESGFI